MEHLEDRGGLLSSLRSAPSAIGIATRDVVNAQLFTPPRPGEWSAVEVLAHLRSCADVWGSYIARILTEEAPVIRAVNPRSYAKQTDYSRLDFAESLAAFTSQRWALLAVLEALPAAAWERSAVVKGGGRPQVRSVQEYVEKLARHERRHLVQLARAGSDR